MADGGWSRRLLPSSAVLLGSTSLAAAQSIDGVDALLASFDPARTVAVALSLGALAVAVATSVLLVRSHRHAAQTAAAHERELAALRARLDDAESVIAAEPVITVSWRGAEDSPEIAVAPAIAPHLPAGQRVLAFGTWLLSDSARAVEGRVDALRARGEAFSLMLRSQRGEHIAAEGRAIAGRAVLRLKDVTAERRAAAEVEERAAELEGALRLLHRLLEAVGQPAWIRSGDGRLAWANSAYAGAVEAGDGAAAVDRGLEFLDRSLRDEVVRARLKGQVFRRRLPAVVAGTRRLFDVVDVPANEGSAGLALDVSDLESVRAEMSRHIEAHRRTLDEIATAVAIFRADGSLVFHNQAYRQLFHLDPAFLDQGPTDAAILERLRSARRLPEQSDFRQWKENLHAAYRALEPKEHWWHLPDGKTIRVFVSPNPEGGVTYLFDDVTERLDLESRYNALTRVQSETLDHLFEAVAVFGSDGVLKLYNPAFQKLWKLPAAELAGRPHAVRVIELARALHDDRQFWEAFKASLTALPERRTQLKARIERGDGSTVDVATVPLPDGATMATFTDVTSSVAIERALREKNEALEAAGHLKNDFVKHMSYELRSPLTNIIGFTQLLAEEHVGPLTERQREYASHVLASSAALLAIVDDILDLATIDAGIMELSLGEVPIRATMEAAAEGVRDRLAEGDIRLDIETADDIGSFVADEKRVRQILFNLLSNAIGFSAPGGRIVMSAERTGDEVAFTVADEGTGIPPELVDRVFDRFESHVSGSRHRGVGLGLSIVRSFVELHGGSVSLETDVGTGTRVTCRFPARRGSVRAAA